jgi:single-strand DNA-binding protein
VLPLTVDGNQKDNLKKPRIGSTLKPGEICQSYLAKGRLVFIEGRLQTDRYETDDEVRYFTKVVASQMQMLDRKPEDPDIIEEG